MWDSAKCVFVVGSCSMQPVLEVGRFKWKRLIDGVGVLLWWLAFQRLTYMVVVETFKGG